VAEGFLGAEVRRLALRAEALDLIFSRGSAPARRDDRGKDGVGMDVFEPLGRLNGRSRCTPRSVGGSRLTLKLPVTLIVLEALTVRAGDERLRSR